MQAATVTTACIDTAELIASDLRGLGFLKLRRSISALRGKDQTHSEAPQKSYDRCVTVTLLHPEKILTLKCVGFYRLISHHYPLNSPIMSQLWPTSGRRHLLCFDFPIILCGWVR